MRKKRKIKVPAAEFGLNSILENADSIIDLITNPLTTSSATTGKEAAAQSLANVGKGIMTGASVGGPLGAAVGAAVGAIGQKGQEAEMTSFTDYDEGTLGTGLIGAFTNGKLKRRRKYIRQNAYDNRDAVRGTEYLANEYAMKYGNLDNNSFANGGSTSSLAYVDDGELINTPDGNIRAIPEQGKPTDSNLVNLPEGSRILSNTLKVPGSKETFAEAGKKIMKRKKSLSNDIYAQNAAKLNDMNAQQAFNDLFSLQESVKAKRGIKPKSKSVQAFENGGFWNNIVKFFNGLMDLNNRYEGIDPNVALESQGKHGITVLQKGSNNNLQPLPVANTVNGGQQPEIVVTATRNQSVPTTYTTGTARRASATTPTTATTATVTTPPTVEHVVDDIVDPNIDLKPVTIGSKSRYADIPEIKSGTNWIGLLPILDNLFSNTPEIADAVYNPYSNAILNAMRGRRFDITAAMNDIRRNRAISNYNADQMNTNTGANLAYRIASQRATDDAIQALRSQESNVNNAYLADYANVANNLGQQWVNSTVQAAEINRRNRAAARNIRRSGLSQLSQWGQNETLMRNQARRDNAMLNLYAPFLQSGFTTDAYNNFIRYMEGK